MPTSLKFLFQLENLILKFVITNSFVTKCSANNYHSAINNTTPISTGEFNTGFLNGKTNNKFNFVYDSPVIVLYDFTTIDFARAFVGGCIPLRGRK